MSGPVSSLISRLETRSSLLETRNSKLETRNTRLEDFSSKIFEFRVSSRVVRVSSDCQLTFDRYCMTCILYVTYLTMCLPRVPSSVKFDCQSKIRQATRKVLFDKHVFAFEISVSNAGLKKVSMHLSVKVGKTTGHAPSHATQLRPTNDMTLKIISKRAILMILSDKPVLYILAIYVFLSCNEMKNIFMFHVARTVDLLFTDPSCFEGCRENFNCNCIMQIVCFPYGAKLALRNNYV